MNLSISNDDKTSDYGSEPLNDLSCDIKTISTPTVMHNDNSSCKHGCILDRVVTGQVDDSVRGLADGVLTLSIYNDNETYGSGSEPVNDLSCDTRIIPIPTGLHIGNSSQSIPCSIEALSDISSSLAQSSQVVLNSSKKYEIARDMAVTKSSDCCTRGNDD